MGDGTRPPGNWMPEKDIVLHQLIGKLAEEASELAGICARILIQGIDESNPDDGKPNRHALIEELSDVEALTDILCVRYGIEADTGRIDRKWSQKEAWLQMLEGTKPGGS